MKILGVLFFIVLAVGCVEADESDHTLVLNGRIDSIMVAKLKEASKNITNIRISSSGGFPSQAIKMLEVIDEQGYNIEIGEVCFSACAEYILPVAQSNKQILKIAPSAFIGFHWNAQIIEQFVRSNIDADISHCTFQDGIELSNLQKKNGANPDFWKEVLVRLGQDKSQVRLDVQLCPQVKMMFENQIWLPTSRQLKELYWLKFTGKVCADDFKACSKQIDENFPPNIKFIIGEELHISQ